MKSNANIFLNIGTSPTVSGRPSQSHTSLEQSRPLDLFMEHTELPHPTRSAAAAYNTVTLPSAIASPAPVVSNTCKHKWSRSHSCTECASVQKCAVLAQASSSSISNRLIFPLETIIACSILNALPEDLREGKGV